MARIYISLGTSIEREKYLQKGLAALTNVFGELTLSSLFESQAIGFNGPDFFNMVIGVSTSKNVEDVASCLKQIELENGRLPNATKFSPRTLDLDLLLYDDLTLSTPVQIPRDEITKNAFVLWPLAEVASETVHPITKLTYRQLWQQFDKNHQQLKKVPFNWPSE